MKLKRINLFLILVLIISLFSYRIVLAANDNNKIKIKSAKIESILTGSNNFDSNDDAGNDSSNSNRIVRSFDTITYNFSFLMADKDGNNDYSDKVINIDVELTEEEAKYVSFEINSSSNERKHTYTFDGINTYNRFQKSITLYILGAPNNTQINPKFVIKESTDLDGGVYLGKVSSEENYYEVEDNNYSTNASFENYMPTIVSSKKATLKFETLSKIGNGKTIYEGTTGRFITVVSGLYIEGNANKGIMGLDMPTSDINFNMSFNQNTNTSLIMKKEWARFYNNNENDIDVIKVDMPFSTISDENQYIKSPGIFNVIIDNNTYKTTVSDYNISYVFPTLTATRQEINNRYYIGTYAYTVFSPRTNEDGKNTINVNYELTSLIDEYQIEANTGTINNEYFSSSDYSFYSGFYINDDKKLNMDNNIESLSKGTDLLYKTTFNYNASFNNGLKEVIKLNPYAFKLLDNDSVKIDLICNNKPCENIKSDDFEIRYISGDFSNSNYSINDNYEKIDDDNNISMSTCQNINIEDLSSDQILNLYGGPCLKPNSEVEKSYININENNITKIVIQTKSNVILPNDIIVNIDVKLRIKNVPDLTRLYQVSTVVSTSDYDNKISYYYPNLNNAINPNNYLLPVIEGKNIITSNNVPYADSVRVVNYTSTQKIMVLNKSSDNKEKTNYNVENNEIITYDIEPIITDNGEKVGLDDTYILKYIKLNVLLPTELSYIPSEEIDKYLINITNVNNTTNLEYIIPFTKPNIKNDHIRFKAKLSSKIKGKSVPVTINSNISALNINKENDYNLFKQETSSYTIYANGNINVVSEQKNGNSSSLIEKNEEFSYLLATYNNTDSIIDNYSIMDILPSNNDKNGSKFSGDYEVKLIIPSSLVNVKVYCSTKKYNELIYELDNSNNDFEECDDLLNNYKKITAFKITNISINPNSYIDDIRLIIKPNGNNYSDKYINYFIGGTSNSDKNNSNITTISVISRSISGKVFYDKNENGIQDNIDNYVPNIPVTLFKIDGENETKVSETITNKDGTYTFKDLDIGRYYINLNYDGSKYDLTYRYASSFENIDSDAYKVSDTIARISNKKIVDDPFGIHLSKENISLDNYDMGLIPRYSFGFDINKYITKIDLTYGGNTTTNYYNNEKRVLLDVRNSLLATAKIYYGIAITNNSLSSGYATLIEESIPKGLIFDPNEPENKPWTFVDGKAYNDSLSNTLIEPGETKYLQIVLYMPKREEATSFINTVSIIKISEYKKDLQTQNDNYINPNKYEIGESVNYAGMSWHVIDALDEEDESQKITLFADTGSISEKLSHTNDVNDLYKWSLSNINNYLNSNSMNSSLDYSVLYDNLICNDSSGMQVASYGGSIQGICQSYEFIKSKVRLLTLEEYTKIKTSTLSNIDWLTGSEDYWLESADDTRPVYSMYGLISDINNSSHNKALYVNESGVKSDLASSKKEIRPVITISSNNILFD